MSANESDWGEFVDWRLVLPPNRPNAHVLRLAEKMLMTLRRDEPALVLGATPEYRDLLARLGFTNVIVIDKYPEFYSLTASLRAYTNAETLLIGDWRERLRDLEGQCRVVLSDLTLGNVPYIDHRDFAHSIYYALRPGGVFFDRVLGFDKALLTVRRLTRIYRSLPLNLITINDFNADFLFGSELIQDGVVDTTAIYRDLDTQLLEPTLKALAAGCRRVSPPGAVWYYGRPWAEVKSDYYYPSYRSVEELRLQQFRGRCRIVIREK